MNDFIPLCCGGLYSLAGVSVTEGNGGSSLFGVRCAGYD